MSIYKDNGFVNRDNYLQSLSEDYNVDLETVYALANLYGPTEDFDGLVNELDSLSGGF